MKRPEEAMGLFFQYMMFMGDPESSGWLNPNDDPEPEEVYSVIMCYISYLEGVLCGAKIMDPEFRFVPNWNRLVEDEQ